MKMKWKSLLALVCAAGLLMPGTALRADASVSLDGRTAPVLLEGSGPQSADLRLSVFKTSEEPAADGTRKNVQYRMEVLVEGERAGVVRLEVDYAFSGGEQTAEIRRASVIRQDADGTIRLRPLLARESPQ